MIAAATWPRDDPSFPPQLAEIPSPPTVLHTLGNRDTLNAPCVAIVGTRHPTPYGERVTTTLTRALAEAGICIISGMALGIDGIAHRTTLTVKGRTAAILGTAIDQPYPRRHNALYQALTADGLVISEHPSGTPPFTGCFPRRNRIIAGLATITVIIEAGLKSGALITANYAADYGRTVAAIPGPIDAEQSRGTNRLIRDGANVVLEPDDVFTLLGLHVSAPTTPTRPQLDGDQAQVWDAVTPGRDMDAIVAATGLSASRCAVAVTMLELRGLVTCMLNGEIQKR